MPRSLAQLSKAWPVNRSWVSQRQTTSTTSIFSRAPARRGAMFHCCFHHLTVLVLTSGEYIADNPINRGWYALYYCGFKDRASKVEGKIPTKSRQSSMSGDCGHYLSISYDSGKVEVTSGGDHAACCSQERHLKVDPHLVQQV